MVGVPRSKGCRICVQRRVKCDQTRPFCSNCKKGNRPCPGYGQDMKFQDEGPKLRQRYQHKLPGDDEAGPSAEFADVSSMGSSGSSPNDSPSPAGSRIWDWQGLDVDKSQLNLFGMVQAQSHIPIPNLDDDDFMHGGTRAGMLLSSGRLNFDEPFDAVAIDSVLFSPNIEQQQLLYTFACSFSTPSSGEVEPALRSHGRWLSRLPDMTGTHPLLDTSVRAVTLAHLGRLHGNEAFMNESRPYYGKALRLLNTALLDDELGMASETLSATILLSFYEMFASEANEAWVRHAGGAGTLMRIRGPARHRYGFDREIFLAYRHALIIEAFQHDKPCFLDEPDWRELSQQIHDDIRTSGIVGERLGIFDVADAFFMEMVQIPGLMCDSRNLKERAILVGDPKAAKAEIIERAARHRTNLKAIFSRMSAALRNMGHAPTSYISGDSVIPVYYKYVNIFVASSHTGYWSLLMLLNMLLRELEPNGEKASLYSMENREAALDCCRSEPYMASSSFLGPFFVIFALRLSLAILEPKQEREWVIQKLYHIGNTNMAMAKHLPPFSVSPKVLPKIRIAIDETDSMDTSGSE